MNDASGIAIFEFWGGPCDGEWRYCVIGSTVVISVGGETHYYAPWIRGRLKWVA